MCWGDFILSKFHNQFCACSEKPGKIQIRVAVWNQDDCSVAGQRMNSSENYNNKAYGNIIDNLYVIVQAKITRGGT